MVAPGVRTSDPASNVTEPEAMFRSTLAAKVTLRVPKSSVQPSLTSNPLSMVHAPVAGQAAPCRVTSAAVQAVSTNAERGRRPVASTTRPAAKTDRSGAAEEVAAPQRGASRKPEDGLLLAVGGVVAADEARVWASSGGDRRDDDAAVVRCDEVRVTREASRMRVHERCERR